MTKSDGIYFPAREYEEDHPERGQTFTCRSQPSSFIFFSILAKRGSERSASSTG
jgi:hypothetical protein